MEYHYCSSEFANTFNKTGIRVKYAFSKEIQGLLSLIMQIKARFWFVYNIEDYWQEYKICPN